MALSARRLLRACVLLVPLLALAHLLLGAVRPPRAESVLGSDAIALRATVRWGVRTLLTVAAALCLVLGPGVALRAVLPTGTRLRNPAFLWVPGFVLLVMVGLAAWGLAAFVEPATVSTILLLPVPLWVLWTLKVRELDVLLRPAELATCAFLLLMLLVGVGRATWSQDPDGTLYAGQVSRTLEAGDRPDSRIQYHVVQLVAHGTSPDSERAESYFAPYTFFDRGPIAGLAAAPIVLTSGADPPLTLPDQSWAPFDPQGFAAYRIVQMLLGCTVALSVLGLLGRFLSERASVAGIALVALSPFVVHEVYFTWPKLLAASLGLVALVALLQLRPWLCGLLLGVGYLAHPGLLLAVPGIVATWAVLLWWGPGRLCDGGDRYPAGHPAARLARDVLRLSVGLAVVLVAWRLVAAGRTNAEFGAYLFESDGVRPVGFGTWLEGRLQSLGNLLVPLRVFLFDRDSRSVNSFFGPSPGIVQFSFSYFVTVPFAVGIAYFPVFVAGLYRTGRRSPALLLAAVGAPFLGFVIYWGSSVAGGLREGLHFVLLVALLAAFLGHSTVHGLSAQSSAWAAVVRACVSVRAVEVLFMLLVPTVLTTGLLGNREFLLTDLAALAAMIGGTAGLTVLTWRTFGKLSGADRVSRPVVETATP
ncbi:MAG: hypothetical protein ACRDY6_21620 [Acidimicrobiia bacterium]